MIGIGENDIEIELVHVTAGQGPQGEMVKFRQKASYLVTGGLGGFGMAVAKWLARHGAKNLVLIGRSGAMASVAKREVAALRRQGARVMVVKTDVADTKDVERTFRLVDRKMPPVRGIFHAAMVLDDGMLPELTAERFSRVMSPKISGAWNLHAASAKLLLDHFVLFSSVSALVGAAGQANYAAANCFLDQLAHYRRALGLPGLSVNWGALSEVGFLARNVRVAEYMTAHGVNGISPEQATAMLGHLLQRDVTQIGFMHIDWQKFFGSRRNPEPPPIYSEVFTPREKGDPGDNEDIRRAILSAPAEERLTLLAAHIAGSAAKVLRTNSAKLEGDRPLKEMGLDSLMAFELLNRLEVQFGILLPSGKVSSGATINSLASAALEIICSGAAKGGTTGTSKAGHMKKAVIGPAVNGKQLIALRDGGDKIPVFFIHPADGSTDIYEELAEKLPEGFPVYGIQSCMLGGTSERYDTMEELANRYAGLIAGRQPDGDLQLAGFSVGGLFALATANMLERSGRKVSFVGMIDTPVAVLDPDYPRVHVLKNLIAEMYDFFTGERSLFQPFKTDGLSGAMMQLAEETATARSEDKQLYIIMDWLAKRGVDMGDIADSGAKKFFELCIIHANLVRAARLKTVNAPVCLWRAASSHLTSEPITPDICRRITRGGLSEEVLEGRHFELMHQPLVWTLAARLAQTLAK